MVSDTTLTLSVLLPCGIGMLFAIFYTWQTSLIRIEPGSGGDKLLDEVGGVTNDDSPDAIATQKKKIYDISEAIRLGAETFLWREYLFCAIFIVVFGTIIFVVLGVNDDVGWGNGIFTTIAFVCGCCTSILSGYIGMKIAVYANSRTATQAQFGYGPAFVTSFKAAAVMGFSLTALALFVLYVVILVFGDHWKSAYDNSTDGQSDTRRMYEAIAGYGLGGSCIGLFGRVGGGIYTKAADVGADLCGKLEFDLPEDDPRNPAVIADNVGDNVGDVAGMGADLFGSFAESTCAAMVVSSQTVTIPAHMVGKEMVGPFTSLSASFVHMSFPLTISAAGIIVCLLTSFFATHLMVVKEKADIESSLKRQLLVSTFLMTPTAYMLCKVFLPDEFAVLKGVADLHNIQDHFQSVKDTQVFACICCGLWSGLIIGYITEYYTSHSYSPVRQVANACETGAATNIIYGLALGYKSVIIPVFCLCITIYTSYSMARMYGIAMAALGILSTLAIGLTIDCYGPICDNAGGIAEMAGMSENVRERTDALDAAGNTTAAIGKGFAIGSAALVSLALFGGFVTIRQGRSTPQLEVVDVLSPFVFAGLLFGAMLPYWFSAMTMKSVGEAALDMVKEVRRQFTENPGILDGTTPPDYARCVSISTDASLREMMYPGALVIFTPLLVGFFFGVEALAGVLAGALTSGVQMAISSSNTGGAWDNAKKYIEAGELGEGKGKGSEEHKAAVIGDTVGDPLKDTSGPSLNILIKLMAIISLVFANSFPETGYFIKLWHA